MRRRLRAVPSWVHRRLRGIPLWARATIVAVVMIVLLGGGVAVGILALSHSDTATSKAQAATTKAQAAAARAEALAQCVNKALGQRTKVSDTPAIIEAISASSDFSQAILALFANPPHPTPAQQAAEGKAILDATTDYAHHLAHAAKVLDANKVYRDRHPLGTC